jgi:hypothetical protein
MGESDGVLKQTLYQQNECSASFGKNPAAAQNMPPCFAAGPFAVLSITYPMITKRHPPSIKGLLALSISGNYPGIKRRRNAAGKTKDSPTTHNSDRLFALIDRSNIGKYPHRRMDNGFAY